MAKFVPTWRKRYLLGLALLAGPAVGAFVAFKQGPRPLYWGSVAVFGFVVVFLLLTGAVAKTNTNEKRKEYGFLEPLIGTDGYASTSKTAIWLWTLVFASALVFLTAVVIWGGLTADDAFGGDWSSYLLLLGGPFAAAVLAKGIASSPSTGQSGGSTVAAGTDALAASAAPDSKPTPGDLVKDSNGEGSLSDLQYAVFTLVAIFYFVGAFVTNIVNYASDRSSVDAAKKVVKAAKAGSPNGHVSSHIQHLAAQVPVIHLPTIPPALLGLTSLAALTYVGTKAVATNGIRLVSARPLTLRSGRAVTFVLVNASPGLTQSMVSVVYRDTDGNVIDNLAANSRIKRVGATITFSALTPDADGKVTAVVVTPDGQTAPTTITLETKEHAKRKKAAKKAPLANHQPGGKHPPAKDLPTAAGDDAPPNTPKAP